MAAIPSCRALDRALASAAAWTCAGALLLAGCATPPKALEGPVITGRMAVRSDPAPDRDARAASGQFELSGSPSRGQLVLTSPIGTIVAQARWSAPDAAAAHAGSRADIELEANGQTRRFDNFDDMTEAALGQSLPLAAMFDWLAGRPWAQAPAVFDADRGAFMQLGWRVDRSRYDSDGLVAADRALPPPALHVRVKLDRAAAASTAASAPADPAEAAARPASAPAR